MNKRRRGHGDGGIDERGENVFRLRYRVSGQRFSKTFRGTLSEARKELRRLVKSADDDEHIEPDKLTLGQWIDHWISIGGPATSGGSKLATVNRAVHRIATMPCYADARRAAVAATPIE